MLSGMSPGGLLSTAAGRWEGTARVVGLCGPGDGVPAAGALLVGRTSLELVLATGLPEPLHAAAPSANNGNAAAADRLVLFSMVPTLGTAG